MLGLLSPSVNHIYPSSFSDSLYISLTSISGSFSNPVQGTAIIFGVIIIIIIGGTDSTEQATHNSFGLRQCDIYITFLESWRSGYSIGVSERFPVMM